VIEEKEYGDVEKDVAKRGEVVVAAVASACIEVIKYVTTSGGSELTQDGAGLSTRSDDITEIPAAEFVIRRSRSDVGIARIRDACAAPL
jgi:hypothetical protein